MEKAIEIKRRAQRCILNGDLDGALVEYQRLIESGDSDPYHSVLLADLLYKKGDRDTAAARYLDAVNGYEVGALVKNAIAICKKMSRLGLAPEIVLERLGRLHAADGLVTEAGLYYLQHAEVAASERKYDLAERSLREAFQVCPDNVHVLERLGELLEKTGKPDAAAKVFAEASIYHGRAGAAADAERCRERAERLHPGAVDEASMDAQTRAPAPFEDGLAMDRLDHGIRFDEGAVEAPEYGALPGPISLDPMIAPDAPGKDSGWGDIQLDVTPAAGETPAHVFDLDAAAPSFDAEPAAPTFQLEPLTPAFEAAPEAPAFTAPTFELEPMTPTFDLDSAPAGEQPGLRLESHEDAAPPSSGDAGAVQLGDLLQEARQLFEQGDHEAAGATLIRAARAYELAGQLDNAATIYRNLAQTAPSDTQVLLLWHDNCQRRNDLAEAARVACELGDRALMQSDAVQAREWFERARSYDGTNELALRRLERLGAPMENGGAPVGPVAPLAGAPAPPGGRTLARGGMIEISSNRDEPVVVQLGSLIAEFQERIQEQVARDPQSQYDLGMSYREMGLFDEAVQAFEAAGTNPDFRVRCSEMIGRCLLDRGDFDRAAEIFRATLMLPNIHPDGALDVAFQLGLALEAGGRTTEALQQFERIYVVEQNYPDVAAKIRALRQAQEQG